MIFDSREIQQFLIQYADEPDYKVPHVVFLARSDKLSEERKVIESLVASVPVRARKDWVRRLISTKEEQHLGAWFEIMLYEWLQNIGQVTVQPSIEGNFPDFSVLVGNQEVIVEASAIMMGPGKRNHHKRENEIFEVLKEIQKPFVVSIETFSGNAPLDRDRFRNDVIEWLDSYPEKEFAFSDVAGNRIILAAQAHAGLEHICIVGIFRRRELGAPKLRPALHNKARQHRTIRKAGFPYVLAVLLEDIQLTAEDVVMAWFGRPQIVFDRYTGAIVEQRLDMSGIHFFKSEIVHESVSGTLVFHRIWNKQAHRREFESMYVQNPYANVSVDPDLFAVRARYLVMEQTADGYRMGWQPKEIKF